MLSFVDEHYNRCSLSRRQWLQLGGLAGVGLTGLLASPCQGVGHTTQVPGFGKAKSVILIYASGGQSQIDTWDPKPEAPADVRGEFQAISTAIPGISVCEHMPRLARLADRYTIVRSMSHEDLDHGSATYLSLTGRYHRRRSSNPDPSPDDLPTYGAVLRRVRPSVASAFDAVHINGPALVPTKIGPGQDGGLLGREFQPLVLGDVSQQTIAIPGLAPQTDLPPVRHAQRRTLRETLDRYARRLESHPEAMDRNLLYRQAYEMLSSVKYGKAFDLGNEPASLRERYGMNRSGQACLLARRLVEAGVPMITVIWNHSNRGQDLAPSETDQYGWDTHNDIFQALKVHLLPRFDQGFSVLLEDLAQRGLLDETLVICMGEFGRAPKVAFEARFEGRSPGRKHWSSVYSIVVAGAGVQQGQVLGASDRLGASPRTDRYGPWDVAATIYSALGIDPTRHYVDQLQRPFPVAIGRPMEQLYQG